MVLLLHVLFVLFAVLGFLLILVGGMRGWPWVRNMWFRLVHMVAVGVVVVQSWLGLVCPLTAIEMEFRIRADDAVYSGAFISHWLQVLLYYEGPPWVFSVVYTAFGAAVLVGWVWIRPRRLTKSEHDDGS